jgi:hypothetical protein
MDKCKKCGRAIALTRWGWGHVATFARKVRADWHRAQP